MNERRHGDRLVHVQTDKSRFGGFPRPPLLRSVWLSLRTARALTVRALVLQAFKLNVDSRGALKDSIVEDGTALLAIMPGQQSGTLTRVCARARGQIDILVTLMEEDRRPSAAFRSRTDATEHGGRV